MNTTPQRLGKYELQQQLGRGSVGEVWKAHDYSARRDVALKLLHTDLQRSDPNFMTRFITEGQAIVSLHHSNIVQVYEIDIARSVQSSETTAYIASELIEGQTLSNYLDATSRKGYFPSVDEIVYLFTSLGVAIDYAHQQNIIHGNIKPGNILLNKQDTSRFAAGEPLLTDFGFSQLLSNDQGAIGSIASPLYMSPEQAKGYPANKRSDIYSLGILLYEICTGVLPFRDESSVAVMMQHINTLPTPPILINPNVPPALSEVILRAIAKDTSTRFSLASLLATAIADACSMQSSIHITKNAVPVDDEATLPPVSNIGTTILGVSQPLPPPAWRAPSQPLPPPISQPLRTTPLSPSQPIPRISSRPLPAATLNSSHLPAVRPAQITQPTARIPMSASQPHIPAVPPPAPNGPVPAPAPQSSQELLPSSPFPSPSARSRILRFTDAPVYIVVAALVLLLIVLGSAIGTSLLLNKGQASGNNPPGRVFFQDDALGHADQLRITLQNVPAPQNGKTYYAWLLDTDQHTRSLGPLPFSNGSASLLYQGDAAHTNLLSITQGILVTSEDTGSQPQAPTGNKIYQASFDTPMLQALKNILYQTPNLPGNEGVAAGLVDTIKSMNDKAQSIVDSLRGHDYTLVTRQATRIIEMIDGTKYATSNGDLPARYPRQLFTAVGLISSPTQSGYIDTLDKQLDAIKLTANNDPMLLQHIQNAKNAVTDLRDWIQKIRTLDVQILKAADLKNPAILGVALQLSRTAADSYTGRTIPPNQGPTPNLGSAGAYQAYTECQYMATLDLQAA